MKGFGKLQIVQHSARTMAASKPAVTELDILLVGKTGAGKSSSGNSIIGHNVFVTSDCLESVTFETVVNYARRDKYNIKIVDTPGLFDTRFANDSQKMAEYAVEKLSESFFLCPKGFHAIVLVLKYPSRMTAEETEAVNQLRQIFGEDFIKNHCVIIVTNGENFDLEAKKRKYGSFEKWCEDQTGAFGCLVRECNNRVVLFYNLSDDDRKTRAINKFLSLVAKIGNRYTSMEFNKWKKNRESLIVKSGLVQLKKSIEPKIDILANKLTEIEDSDDSTEDMLDKLRMLTVKVQDIKTEIDLKDRDTDVLKSLKKTVVNLELAIDRAKEDVYQREMMKQTDQMFECFHRLLERPRYQFVVVESDRSSCIIS